MDRSARIGEIVRQLRLLNRHLRTRLHASAVAHGHPATMPQLALMRVLSEHGPQRAIDLSHRTGLSASSITGFIDRIEAEQLVWRERSSNDRREILIHLTERGQQLIAQMHDIVDRELGAMFDVLTDDELDQLGRVARKLLDATSDD